MKATPSYEAVGKLVSIVNCFVDESSSWGVRELAAHLAMSKSTVHRMLSSLTLVDWLQYDERVKRYTVGFELYRMAMVLSQNTPLVHVARPYLDKISKATGESVILCYYRATDRKVVFLDLVESIHPLRYEVKLGVPRLLHAGATGRSIMAFLSPEIQREMIETGLEQITDRTLVQPELLEAKLAETRSLRYAVSSGERIPGAISVAAPFWDATGLIGSIALTVPEQRVTSDEVIHQWGELLLKETNELSALLGFHNDERRRPHETKGF